MRIEYDGTHHGLFRIVADGAEVINLTVEGNMHYTGDRVAFRGGGIVGECDHGRIENCHFRGTIDGGRIGSDGYSRTDLTMVGGIVGYAHDASTIINCTAEGTFTATGAYSQVGGIVGQNAQQTLSQTVRDCHTTADCHVTGSMAGGIAGYLYGQSTELRDCSSGAEVTGLSEGGGIIGMIDGRGLSGCQATEDCHVSSSVYAGGLVGRLSNGSLLGCSSLAEVTGTTSESRTGFAGGLIGFNDSDDYIIGCYFAGTVQAPERSDAFVGYANSYAYKASSYTIGRVLMGDTEDPSFTNYYYTYKPFRQVDIDFTEGGQSDWAAITAELNNGISRYNTENGRTCRYHFVQNDGATNPPTLAEGAPEGY